MSEEKDATNWDLLIGPVLFSIRSSRNASTRMPPFRILYVREERRPIEIPDNDQDIAKVMLNRHRQ